MPFYLERDQPEAAMRDTTIFFYATPDEGREAQALVASERAAKRLAFARDANTFDGPEKDITRVVIGPKVRPHHAERIVAAYGDRVARAGDAETTSDAGGGDGEGGEASGETIGLGQGEAAQAKKQAVNRGRGRWFVTQGEVTLSGPHTQAEAEEIAAR